MRIAVNLASHPYVELRPVYNRLRTWMVILALVGLALWFLYRSEHDQAEQASAHVAGVQHNIRQLENQQRSYQALMQQPKEAAILQQSDFLNSLFRRKAFSWTATMTDLENVLPSGVQVLSIDPIIAPDGHVTIRLRVTGSRDRALDLIRNLEKSKHFAAPRVASETLSTGAGAQNSPQNINASGDVNFDILADYRPLTVSGSEKTTTEQAAATATRKPRRAARTKAAKGSAGTRVSAPGRRRTP